MTNRWRPAMLEALAEAALAPVHGDVPIGAVVLDASGRIVARAHNERELTGDPSAHAEILALRRAAVALATTAPEPTATLPERTATLPERTATVPEHTATVPERTTTVPELVEGPPPPSWRLDGCTLVVTLEPCTMCAGALVLSRVDRLVFGAYDPKAGAVASLWDVVRDPRLNHRVDVVGGIEADACGEVIQDFFAAQR